MSPHISPREPGNRRFSLIQRTCGVTALAAAVVVIAWAARSVWEPAALAQDPVGAAGTASTLGTMEPADASIHRGWVVVPEGVFLLVSPEIALGITAPDLGYLLYWWDFPRDAVFVFDVLAVEKIQLGQAVMALRRDLDVDYTALIYRDETLNSALVMTGEYGRIDGAWRLAQGEVVLALLNSGGAETTLDDVDGIRASVEQMMNELASHPNPNGGPGAPIPPGVDLGRGGSSVQIPRGGDVGDELPESCLCCQVGLEEDDPGRTGGGSRPANATCCFNGVCDDGEPCTINDKCGGPFGLGCGPESPSDCCGSWLNCPPGPCDRSAFCEGGVCVQEPKTCEDDGNVCTQDECNEATGDCYILLSDIPCGTTSNVCTKRECVVGDCDTLPDNEGAACDDDGNICTQHRCRSGSCDIEFVNDGLECATDNDPCTKRVCNATGGCVTENDNEGGACDDDGNICTDDVCQGGTCEHPPGNDGTECLDDGNFCTRHICQGGSCGIEFVNEGQECESDNDPCTKRVCNATGSCVTENDNEGGACDDEVPPNECTDDVCQGGVCTHPPVGDGSPCTPDEDPCTDDICQGGACTHPESTLRGTCGEDDTCCGGNCCPAAQSCCDDVCCEPGEACCGNVSCCAPDNCCEAETACCANCCDNDVCCNEVCEECLDHGSLTPASIVTSPAAPCVGDTITFTLDEVMDTGGLERVFCTAQQSVPPGPVDYSWDGTKPDGSPIFGIGRTAIVIADQPGDYEVTFRVTPQRIKCPPADLIIGPEMVETCSSGPVRAASRQTCGMTITFEEITFSNDHTMYDEAPPCNAALCWGAGSALSGPDWKNVNNPDHPASYTKGTAMVITARIEVEGSGGGTATLRVTGPDGVIGEGDFNVPCGTEERWVTITTSALPDAVKAYTPAGLSWSVRAPGEAAFSFIRTTQHRIYVTLATPTGSEPTNRRMNFVCHAAAQSSDETSAIDGIHTHLDADPPEDGHDPANLADDWKLMAGSPYMGECDEQARFMVLATRILGVLIGTDYLTFPSPAGDCDPTTRVEKAAMDAGITWDLDGDGTIGEEMLILRFDFDGGAGTNINAFEGSVAYTSIPIYYAVWPSLSADSMCKLLLQVRDVEGAVQCWAIKGLSEWTCITDPSSGMLVTVPFPVCGAGCP